MSIEEPAAPPVFSSLGDPPRPVDHLVDHVVAVEPSTVLDELRAELAAPPEGAAEEEVGLLVDVPARPGWAVRYSTDISYDELNTWRKRSKAKDLPGGVNELKLATLVLANKCLAIRRRGADVVLGGETAVFSTPAFAELVGSDGSSLEAVRRLYGRDGHTIAAANMLLAEAGFGDELPEGDEDPTSRATL